MSLGPLKLSPILVPKPWGGTALHRMFGRAAARVPIGESWEVVDRENAQSRVAQGPHAGRTLHDLLEEFGGHLVGPDPPRGPRGRFPLLVKWLDARERLSIQVHPDDKGALALGEGDPGKTEAWIVVEAPPGSGLVYGLREPMGHEALRSALASGDIENRVRWVSPRPGDCFMVPPGTIHALGTGLVVYEVQQNSDLTYRLYDWGRTGPDGRPRDLHVDKALSVLATGARQVGPVRPIVLPVAGGKRRFAVACVYFAVEILEIDPGGEISDGRGERSFHILTGWSGHGSLICRAKGPENGTREAAMGISPGETILVPACGWSYLLVSPAGMRVIKTYVPDLRRDIEAPLLAAGVSLQAIRDLLQVQR